MIMQVEFSRLPVSERISSREFSASQRLKRKGERRRAKSTAWRPRTGRDPRTHRSGTGGRRGRLAARRTSSRCSQPRFDLTTCMPSAHETHTVCRGSDKAFRLCRRSNDSVPHYHAHLSAVLVIERFTEHGPVWGRGGAWLP